MYPVVEGHFVILNIDWVQNAICPAIGWEKLILEKLSSTSHMHKAPKVIKCDGLMLLNQIWKCIGTANPAKFNWDASDHFSKRRLFAIGVFANCTCYQVRQIGHILNAAN